MVQYRKEEGCQVVEMECSALAACAKFRKVIWAMLLFSADTLADPHKYQEREWGKTSKMCIRDRVRSSDGDTKLRNGTYRRIAHHRHDCGRLC